VQSHEHKLTKNMRKIFKLEKAAAETKKSKPAFECNRWEVTEQLMQLYVGAIDRKIEINRRRSEHTKCCMTRRTNVKTARVIGVKLILQKHANSIVRVET